MRSSFSGLNTLILALQAQQAAIDTTNHNIANANTEGYSRQVAHMAATTPFTLPAQNKPAGVPLHIGTGVVVTQIQRQRDSFVDWEVRQQYSKDSRWDTLADGLRRVEGVFNEPGDSGLQVLISNFFNSWSELANNPQSTAIRATVRAEAQTLAVGINNVAGQLEQTRKDVDGAIELKVPEINDAASQLAALNEQIVASVALGDTPNDLRDKRDLILDRLAKLTGATYYEDERGSTTVLLGGRVLVVHDKANQIYADVTTLATGTQLHQLRWKADSLAATIDGGEMKGLFELRDTIMPQKIYQLDLLATAIAGAVNDVHQQGFGMGTYASTVSNFFDPMTSSTSLNQTGIGNQLVGGTITIGSTTVTVNPSTQSLKQVMDSIVVAINATAGYANAAWTLNGTNGTISITYDSTGGGNPQITLGTSSDTSNFLSTIGLRGAPDNLTTGSTRTVAGMGPVALVRAARMDLDQTIKNDTQAIAAAAGSSLGLSTATSPGDNRNALALAALQRTRFGALGDATFEDYFASTISALGVETRQAEQVGANVKLLVQHLEKRRESTSGVSLDEEATQLIRYQRAYQAAARGITTLDDMLETIIMRMGRVGT